MDKIKHRNERDNSTNTSDAENELTLIFKGVVGLSWGHNLGDLRSGGDGVGSDLGRRLSGVEEVPVRLRLATVGISGGVDTYTIVNEWSEKKRCEGDEIENEKMAFCNRDLITAGRHSYGGKGCC